MGRPISSDKLTQTKERLSYARVLVEVEIDAAKELVRNVRIRLPNGIAFDQEVLYEYEPKFCGKCNKLGHSSGECNVPKQGRGSNKQPASLSLLQLQ